MTEQPTRPPKPTPRWCGKVVLRNTKHELPQELLTVEATTPQRAAYLAVVRARLKIARGVHLRGVHVHLERL